MEQPFDRDEPLVLWHNEVTITMNALTSLLYFAATALEVHFQLQKQL